MIFEGGELDVFQMYHPGEEVRLLFAFGGTFARLTRASRSAYVFLTGTISC